jgi:hypothetical protein
LLYSVAATPVFRWNSTGITVAGILSGPGVANNQLSRPFDVAVDNAYSVFVVDNSNQRIQKYAFGSAFGTTVAGTPMVLTVHPHPLWRTQQESCLIQMEIFMSRIQRTLEFNFGQMLHHPA